MKLKELYRAESLSRNRSRTELLLLGYRGRAGLKRHQRVGGGNHSVQVAGTRD